MKRCKSDELQQQQGEEHGAGLEDAACHLPGADLRPGEAAGAHSAGGPSPDAGPAGAPNPGPRSKPPDLKVSADPPLAGPTGDLAPPPSAELFPQDPGDGGSQAEVRQGVGPAPRAGHRGPLAPGRAAPGRASVFIPRYSDILVTHPPETVRTLCAKCHPQTKGCRNPRWHEKVDITSPAPTRRMAGEENDSLEGQAEDRALPWPTDLPPFGTSLQGAQCVHPGKGSVAFRPLGGARG